MVTITRIQVFIFVIMEKSRLLDGGENQGIEMVGPSSGATTDAIYKQIPYHLSKVDSRQFHPDFKNEHGNRE